MKIKKLLALLLALAMVLTSMPLALADDDVLEPVNANGDVPGVGTVTIEFYKSADATTPLKTYEQAVAGADLSDYPPPSDPYAEDVQHELVGWFYNNGGEKQWVGTDKVPEVESLKVYAKCKDVETTITFDLDGGSGDIKSIKKAIGAEITDTDKPTANPTKTGYEFAGWSPAIPDVMPETDMTCKATWTAKTYDVTFKLNGGIIGESGDDVVVTQTFDQPWVVPTQPTKEGHSFKNWSPATTGNYDDETITEVSAVWDVAQFTATFVYNRDGWADSPVKQDYDTALFEPNHLVVGNTYDGYTFLGWDKEIPERMPGEDTTYTASWLINTNKIIFKDTVNDLVFEDERANPFEDVVISKKTGAEITEVDIPTWSRDGYTRAWSTPIPPTMPSSAETDIYARWTRNEYEIMFVDNATNPLDWDDYLYGTTIEDTWDDAALRALIANPDVEETDGVIIHKLSETDYEIFDGWSIEKPDTMPAKDLVVSPKWKTPVTVTFVLVNGDEESKIPEITAKEGSGATVVPDGTDNKRTVIVVKGKTIAESLQDGMPAPKKAAYSLTWRTTQGESGTEYTADTPINESVTLYTVWTLKKWNVTFDAAGGTPEPDDIKDIIDGTKITKPEDPKKEGYRFLGWFDKGATVPFDFDGEDGVTKDLELTAHWDYVVWTIAPLKADWSGTMAAPAATTEYDAENDKYDVTLTLTDLVEWQDWVEGGSEVSGKTKGVDGKDDWYIGVRVTLPEGNLEDGTLNGLDPTTESVTATTLPDGTTRYADVWFYVSRKNILDAIKTGGIIKKVFTGAIAYGDDSETNEFTLNIDVNNVAMKNNPEKELPDWSTYRLPYRVVTKGGVEDLYKVTFLKGVGTFTTTDDIPSAYGKVKANGDILLNVYYGNYVVEPVIERAGYTFLGWFVTDEEGKQGEEFDFEKDVITSDLTLSAKWQANWQILNALRPEGYWQWGSENEGIIYDGSGVDVNNDPDVSEGVDGIITFTDLTAWRNSLNWYGDTWVFGVRLEATRDDIIGTTLDPLDPDSWSTNDPWMRRIIRRVDGTDKWIDVWYMVSFSKLRNELLSQTEDGVWYVNGNHIDYIGLDGTTDVGLDFKVVFDFSNVDLVDLDDDLTDVHKLVTEDGVVQLKNVVFDADNEADPLERRVMKGNTVEKPAPDPDKKGYSFVGWYTTDEEGELVSEFLFDETHGWSVEPVMDDLYLKAKWKATWTITALDSKDGVIDTEARGRLTIGDKDGELPQPTPGDINGAAAVTLAAKDKWIDGAENWTLRIKFTSPEEATNAKIMEGDQEVDYEATTDPKSKIAKLNFTLSDVEDALAANGNGRLTWNLIVYDDENDEEGQAVEVILDLTKIKLIDSTKAQGYRFMVVTENTKPVLWTYTFDYDNADTEDISGEVVDGNWLPKVADSEKEHFKFGGWYLKDEGSIDLSKPYKWVLEEGVDDDRRVVTYDDQTGLGWVPENDDEFTLAPYWKHGYWDIDETSIQEGVNAEYVAEERTLTFNEFDVTYSEENKGYVLTWDFIAPDSLSDDQPNAEQVRAATRMTITAEGTTVTKKFNDVTKGTNASGQYLVPGLITLTEEDMLARAESGEDIVQKFTFYTEGNEGDKVTITVIVKPGNVRFIKDGKVETKIKDGKLVHEVRFYTELFMPPYTVQDVEIDGKATEPEEEIIDVDEEGSWIVTGWTLEPESEELYDFDEVVEDHLDLYAHWERLWTVTFDYDDEEIEPVEVPVIDGELVAKPEDPVKQGYTIIGWIDLDAPEDADYFDFETPITRNVNLQAYYKKNETVIQNGYSAAFQDDLKMAFYYILTLALHDDPTAKATLTGEDGFVNLEKAIVGDGEAQGENYYVATVPIKYFRKAITVKLFKGDEQVEVIDKDGETDDTTFVKSLEDYVEDVNASEKTSANMKALANALKWYGYAAENKFLSGTNDMSGMPAVPEPAEDELIDYGDKSVLAGMGIADVFTTVQFQEANKLNVIFTPAEGSKLEDYTFTIDGKEVDALVVGGDWYVQLSKIFAKNLSDDHVFTITDGTTTYTVTASVTRYAKTIVKKNVGGENMVNLAKAIINYNEAAKKYFANK